MRSEKRQDDEMHVCGREEKRTLSETSGRYKTVRERVAIGLDESELFARLATDPVDGWSAWS